MEDESLRWDMKVGISQPSTLIFQRPEAHRAAGLSYSGLSDSVSPDWTPGGMQ